jgi:ketosteroid isomerase-like protein
MTNKQLIQNIFVELARGNSRPFVEAMDEDFCWIIQGSTPWSRAYRGKQAVLGELFAALRRRIAGRIVTSAQRFIAEDDLVVVEAQGSNLTVSGQRYDNRYCYVFRLAGGKLKELTEYLDTELVSEVLGDPAWPAG